MLLTIAAVLIVFHMLATVVVRYARRGTLNPFNAMMSDYLTGYSGEKYCMAFYLLAVGLVLIGMAWGGAVSIILYIASLGITGTAVTRQYFIETAAVNRAHKACAVAAFLGSSAAELAHLWGTELFPFALAPLAFAFLFNRLKLTSDGFEETGAYFLIMLCFLVAII